MFVTRIVLIVKDGFGGNFQRRLDSINLGVIRFWWCCHLTNTMETIDIELADVCAVWVPF